MLFITNNLIKHQSLVYTQLNDKKSSISNNSFKQKSFICTWFKCQTVLFDPLISDVTTSDQRGPGNNGNEGVLHIPQNSSITVTSPSDCLVSYPGHLLGVVRSYISAEMKLVYSTAPADWASDCLLSYLEHLWVEEVLPLCRDAVSVFWSPSWLGWMKNMYITFKPFCWSNYLPSAIWFLI